MRRYEQSHEARAVFALLAKTELSAVDSDEVREITKTDADGTNLLGLVEGARALGFEAEVLGGNFSFWKDYEE